MSWNGEGGQPIQGDALVSYQHEIYDGWKQGIAFDNVVIGEDGELHNEMLYSEYSVLIIKGKSGLGFDFELCIKKEVVFIKAIIAMISQDTRQSISFIV